ncbi:MAG: TlpA family protein disulfide reductase [Alphaproteobacteria bacterium]|nr:TlpA family protein disulfide reductase [Alphaproteobacteria bacterium]
MNRALSVLLCAGLMACDSTPRAEHEALAARVTALEAGAVAQTPMSEEEAMALYQSLDEAMQAMDWDRAHELVAEAKAKAGHTRVASRVARLADELEVIGAKAPPLEVERWFTSQTDFAQGDATLVVFFEEWCPHCRREVPALQKTWEKYGAEGLNVVGLTRVTKSSTEEKVEAFIEQSGLTYPVARMGDDHLSQAFGVSGIPAAAVVVDGEIVWRGHPARLSEEMIRGWVTNA